MKKKIKTRNFSSVNEIIAALAEQLRPPERMTVHQAAAKYRYINQPGAYVGWWDNRVAPYMVEVMNAFASRDYSNMAFVGPAQCGKPLDVRTPVPTPKGWTTIGQVAVGDTVVGQDGKPTKVTYATPVFIDRECYRITFDDGSSIICDGVHRWSVNDMWSSDTDKLLTKDTNSLIETYKVQTKSGKVRYRYSIPNAKPIDLPKVNLPIDPYLLGFWLGDGRANSGSLAVRCEDTSTVIQQLTTRGYHCKVYPGKGNTAGSADRVRVDGLTDLLRENGLIDNKVLPAAYLRASIEQRRELLRGLCDSDGSAANGRLEWSQSEPELFNQVVELTRTLGYKPMTRSRVPTFIHKGEKRKGKRSYSFTIKLARGSEAFYLQRQIDKIDAKNLSRVTRTSHTDRRFIRDISPVDSTPVRCISVDNEQHLFLVGEQMVPTHNTDGIIVNGVMYSVVVDPMDTMVYCPTGSAARDFSIRRIDRLHRHSPAIGECLLPGSDSDNTFDKHYISGMMLTLSWISVTELAGRPVGRIIMTDFDRMPDDVDGDGNPYDLATKRTTTFGSFAMCAAESSPSRPILDPKWMPDPKQPHQAPPCTGIVALYNRGDRRRWQWPCPECDAYFEGEFKYLEWQAEEGMSNLEIAETVVMRCPHCGNTIHPDQRQEMQQWGMWVPEGMEVDMSGRLIGRKRRTTFASFWLKGVAAAFVTWPKLVLTYLDALDEYNRTLSEDALKKFWNNDMGEPYKPQNMDNIRLPEVLKARAEYLPEQMVPAGVRFLLAAVDVQKNMFRVQVMGIMPGYPFDTVIVDTFDIRKSKRLDEGGDHLWVKPAAYLEDWDLIEEQVMDRAYELSDGSGRMMPIKHTVCDSGGKAGVTDKAYDFWRKMRDEGKSGRFMLLKGDPKVGAPRTRVSFPDSQRKDNKSAARGDIPILMVNSNLMKDNLNGRLDSTEPGKGMYHMPDWLPDSFYLEMCAEIKDEKGKWINPSNLRNEEWDLSYYNLAQCISPRIIGVEGITDWDNAPSWAADWDYNSMVWQPETQTRFAQSSQNSYDFTKLGELLG